MKTFVIAQHHGVFLTLDSMIDQGIKNIQVIIPGSQVIKYNKMYEENKDNKEYAAFKDYDKTIAVFIKIKDPSIQAFIYDDFNIRNTIVSTINAIKLAGVNEIVACIMSGALVIKDYTSIGKDSLQFREMGACYSRVYGSDRQLAMYHMLGMANEDQSIDTNFFIVDMTKVSSNQLSMDDKSLIQDMVKRKKFNVLNRMFNGKDDVLIGSAISARQTVAHNLTIQSGYVVSLWNKVIKPADLLSSDEYFGYPFNCYGKYVEESGHYLPGSTADKIMANSAETKRWTSGLESCLDIIDL